MYVAVEKGVAKKAALQRVTKLKEVVVTTPSEDNDFFYGNLSALNTMYSDFPLQICGF